MKPPCPSCDHDLWHPGHVCYTYEEWARKQEEFKARARGPGDPQGGEATEPYSA